MKEDNQIHPFLPSYSSPPPPIDPEAAGDHKPLPIPTSRAPRGRNSKCLVYTLFLFVILSIIALIFGVLVMRLKPPSISIRSIAVKNSKYNSSYSRPSWEATLVARAAIENGNLYGPMEYETEGKVMYGDKTVGDLKNGSKRRVRAKGKEEVSVGVKVSSKRLGKRYDANQNNGELYSGRLKMNALVRVRGKVVFAKVMKKSKVAELNCTMTLDLVNRQVQDLLCL